MVGEVGFEPTNSLRGQIYSLLPLTARPFSHVIKTQYTILLLVNQDKKAFFYITFLYCACNLPILNMLDKQNV